MPKPNDDESREDFVSRCIPIVLEDGAAEDQDQAVAMCNSIWESHKKDRQSDCEVETDEEHMQHKQFVEGIAKRVGSSETFGYGITTAEPYVRALLELEDAGLTSNRPATPEQLIKDAQQRLVYASPDMVIEKLATVSDTPPVDDVELPANTLMTLQHILTTDREDRDGDVLCTAGAELDPKAPLLWQHQHFLPVGKIAKTIEHTASVLRVFSVLLDINELTSDIAKLIEADALRFSHGFRVLDYEERKDSDGEPTGGFKVTKYEILEGSFVSVPSNVDAEIELYSRGKLESEMFQRHAKQYLDLRKTTQVFVSATIENEQNGDATVPAELKEEDDNAVELVSDETMSKKDETVDTTKAGRVLSQHNIDELKEVIDDLKELDGMELTRPQKALCERCVSRLEKVLAAAKPAEDNDGKTPNRFISTIELADVVNFVLGADASALHKVKETLVSLGEIDRHNEQARQFREFNQIL